MTTRALFQWVSWGVGLALQARLLHALWRRDWRDFPILTVYVILVAVTTVIDIVAFYADFGIWTRWYYLAELIRQSVLFALVVSFGVASTAHSPARNRMLGWILGAATLFWVSTAALLYDPDLFLWMTAVVRNLSFGSALLNLGVWAYLISSRGDTTTLLLSGGLGLQMTGDAIGRSLLQLFPQTMIGGLVTVVAWFSCMIVWIHAITRPRPPGAQ